MAKSEVIKDLANGTITLETGLKRLIVLLHSFDKPQLLDWAKNELRGYPDSASLPKYRIVEGQLVGTFIVGSPYSYATYKNHVLPVTGVDKDFLKAVRQVKITQGIPSLKAASESDGQIGKSIPIHIANILVEKTNVAGVTSARANIDSLTLDTIISTVEERLLELFLLLEKEFGILDDMDIDVSNKTVEQMTSISQKLYLIMFQDNSISIGDNNDISKSEIKT